MFRTAPFLLHRRPVGVISAAPFLASFFTTKEAQEAAIETPPSRQYASQNYAANQAQAQLPAQSARQRKFKIYRQISMGSILGLTTGLILSKFSHVLAFGAGILITIVQVAAAYNIHIIPYSWLGQHLKTKLRHGIEENPGFKISFALAMSMTAFVRDY